MSSEFDNLLEKAKKWEAKVGFKAGHDSNQESAKKTFRTKIAPDLVEKPQTKTDAIVERNSGWGDSSHADSTGRSGARSTQAHARKWGYRPDYSKPKTGEVQSQGIADQHASQRSAGKTAPQIFKEKTKWANGTNPTLPKSVEESTMNKAFDTLLEKGKKSKKCCEEDEKKAVGTTIAPQAAAPAVSGPITSGVTPQKTQAINNARMRAQKIRTTAAAFKGGDAFEHLETIAKAYDAMGANGPHDPEEYERRFPTPKRDWKYKWEENPKWGTTNENSKNQYGAKPKNKKMKQDYLKQNPRHSYNFDAVDVTVHSNASNSNWNKNHAKRVARGSNEPKPNLTQQHKDTKVVAHGGTDSYGRTYTPRSTKVAPLPKSFGAALDKKPEIRKAKSQLKLDGE